MRTRITISLLFLNLLCGCTKNHLYVQQETVNASFLASSHVGTPDPRKDHPPQGQRLLIAWDYPKSLYDQGLTLIATVRLWDNTQQNFIYLLERKRGVQAIDFPSTDKEKRILTYLVQVISNKGDIIDQWRHHFWTQLINVGQNN